MEGGEVRIYTKRGKLKKIKKQKKRKGVGPQTFIKGKPILDYDIPKNEIVEPPKKRGRPPKISVVLPPDEPPLPPKQKKGTFTHLTPGEDWRPGTFETLKEYNERQARRLGPDFKKAIDGFNSLKKEFKRKRLIKLSKISSSNITPEEVEKATSTEQMNKLYIQNLAGVDIDKLKKQGVEVDTNEVLAELGKTAKKPKKPKSSRSKSLERKEPRAERSSVEALDLAPQPKKRGRPKKEKPLASLTVPTLERTSSSSKKSPRTPKEDLPSPRGEKPPPEKPLPPPLPPRPTAAKKKPPMPKGIARTTPVEKRIDNTLSQIKEEAPSVAPLVNKVKKDISIDEKDHDDETARYATLLQATQGYDLDLSQFGRSESRAPSSSRAPSQSRSNEKLKEQLREKSRSRSESVDTLALTIAEREIIKALRDIVLEVEQRDRDEQFKEAQKILDEANAYQALLKEGKKREAFKAIKKIGGVLIKSLKKAKIDAEQIEQLQKANKQYNDATKIQSLARAKQAKKTKESLQVGKQAEAESYLKARLENAKLIKEEKEALKLAKAAEAPPINILSKSKSKSKPAKSRMDTLQQDIKAKELADLKARGEIVKAKRKAAKEAKEKEAEALKLAKETEDELERMADIAKLKEEAKEAKKIESITKIQSLARAKKPRETKKSLERTKKEEAEAYLKSRLQKAQLIKKAKEKEEEEQAEINLGLKKAGKYGDRQVAKAREKAKLITETEDVLERMADISKLKEEADKAQAKAKAYTELQEESASKASEASKTSSGKPIPKFAKSKEERDRLKAEKEKAEKLQQEAQEAKAKLLAAEKEKEAKEAERKKRLEEAKAKAKAEAKAEKDAEKAKAKAEKDAEKARKKEVEREKSLVDIYEKYGLDRGYFKDSKPEKEPNTPEEKKAEKERLKQMRARGDLLPTKFGAEGKIWKFPELRNIMGKLKNEKREATPEELEKIEEWKKVFEIYDRNFVEVEAKTIAERRKIKERREKAEEEEEDRIVEEYKKLKAKIEQAEADKAAEESDSDDDRPLGAIIKRKDEPYYNEKIKEILKKNPSLRSKSRNWLIREIQRLDKEEIEELDKEIETFGTIDLSEEEEEPKPLKKKLQKIKTLLVPKTPTTQEKLKAEAESKAKKAKEEEDEYGFQLPKTFLRRLPKAVTLEEEEEEELTEEQKAEQARAEALAETEQARAERTEREIRLSKQAAEKLSKSTGKGLPYGRSIGMGDLSDGDISSDDDGGSDQIKKKISHNYIMPSSPMSRRGFQHPAMVSATPAQSFHPNAYANIHASHGGLLKSDLESMYHKAIPKALRPAVEELAKDTGMYAVSSKPIKKLRRQAKEGYEKAVPKALRGSVEDLGKDTLKYAGRRSGYGKGMSRSRSSSPSSSPERGGMLGCSVKSKLMGAYKKAVPKALRPAVEDLAKDTARYAVNTKPVKKLRRQAKEEYEKAVPKSLRPAVEELAKDTGNFAKRQAGFGLKKGSEEARKFMAALRARKGKKMKGGKIPAPPSRSPITDPSLL